MGDYGRFGAGGAQYPLTVSTVNTLLRDVDPALFFALDFFQSVLTTHLSVRVSQELARSPAFTWPDGSTGILARTTPIDPVPYLQEYQAAFPLLAVYRVEETIDERSTTWNHRSCRWNVQYIMPPLTLGQAERVLPILKAIGEVLQNRIYNRSDPGYQNGLMVWGPSGANLESIGLQGGTYARWDAGGNLVYPVWTGKLMVVERGMPPSPDQFDKFAGLDATLDLAQPEQPTVDPFVQFSTQPAPTVTLCTPNNGPNAGGTSVTITGTGFIAGATATIGGVPCTSVVVASATSITCTTGAGKGPIGGYQVTVVVTNTDGQSGSLPLGFTFT